jgi:hypothetical protein
MVAGSPAEAQATRAAQESESNSRLLSPEEGRAIVNAALEQGQPERGAQDCSHLVHQAYLDVGFAYPYASSFELYTGNENFVRVSQPHPGDLIVWPGHVGIVVEPLEHSFYSLVSTGLELQNYQGPYWRSRGKPRFYRYKVESGEILTAVQLPASKRTLNSRKTHESALVIEEREVTEDATSRRSLKTASDRGRAGNDPPASPAVAAASGATNVPESMIVTSGNKPPTKEEVSRSIGELSKACGNVLRADNPSKLLVPVVIFERLQVQRLEIKRDHGWARLQIDSRATIAGGATEYKRRREKVSWELRRTANGWEAIRPTDRSYVPQDVAVRNLAGQLAQLSSADGAAAHDETVLRQESQLASLLSGLLENK